MSISKINENVFKAFAELNEFAETDHISDFNTREKSICANIKVYDWLDKDNVVNLIEKNNWQRHSEQILEEFKTNLLSLLPDFAALTIENPTLSIERKVGKYFVERASKVDNDILIKAGCHRFSLNNLLTTFNLSL